MMPLHSLLLLGNSPRIGCRIILQEYIVIIYLSNILFTEGGMWVVHLKSGSQPTKSILNSKEIKWFTSLKDLTLCSADTPSKSFHCRDHTVLQEHYIARKCLNYYVGSSEQQQNQFISNWWAFLPQRRKAFWQISAWEVSMVATEALTEAAANNAVA